MKYYIKQFFKENLSVITVQFIMYCSSAAQSLIQIQIFQCLIDRNINRFFIFISINAITWVTYYSLCILYTRLRSHCIRLMNNRIRKDLSATLLSMSYQEYHSRESGEYLAWFTNGVEEIEKNAWSSFYDYFAYISMIITGLIALASIHWSLLCISLIQAAIIITIPNKFTGRLESLSATCAKAQSEATNRFKDLICGLDVLCHFGKKERFFRGIYAASDEIEKTKNDRDYKQEVITSGIIGNTQTLTGVASIMAVCVLSIKGIIIQSALAGAGNLFSSVCNGIQGFTKAKLTMAASNPYFDRIGYHEEHSDNTDKDGVISFKDNISLRNVTFKYKDKEILKNISYTFLKGGKYAIIGPSGSGKTTLLKLILGWLNDYSGTISIDSVDINNCSRDQLQQQIGYIEQNVFLFNTTIRENITLGDPYTTEQMLSVLNASALEKDLDSIQGGLDAIVGESGSSLSGGQKQRIAIARALFHGRSILLVDEGTSALDKKNADIVEESLLSMPDLTLILVSHHLSKERQKQFSVVLELGEKHEE